jgi:hypothetical protein
MRCLSMLLMRPGMPVGSPARRDHRRRHQQLMGGWPLFVRRRRVSNLARVMPIKEDSAHREEEHEGSADGNDQIQPEIPAVALHHVGPTWEVDDSSGHCFACAASSAGILWEPWPRRKFASYGAARLELCFLRRSLGAAHAMSSALSLRGSSKAQATFCHASFVLFRTEFSHAIIAVARKLLMQLTL